MTRDEARQVLGLLLAAFPKWDIPDQTKTLWLAKLEPFEVAPAQRAANSWVDEEKWPPSWAEMRTKIKLSASPRYYQALPRPELTAKQIAENKARVASIINGMKALRNDTNLA